MQLFKSTLTIIITGLLICGSAHAADLNVEVTGIAEAKGNILIGVFSKTGGWLKNPVQSRKVTAEKGSIRLNIENLPEDDYAISVIHDINANGKLDANAIGMPTEPYGFSNDAAGNFGPPTFEQAKFTLVKSTHAISIRLN